MLLLLGAATYCITLAATLPAKLIASRAALPNEIIDVSGTVWNGQAIVKGGYEARWSVSPLQSLMHLAAMADWTFDGPDTRLRGGAALRPDTATLTSIDGRAGWGLVRLAAPGLGVVCDGELAVSLQRIVIRRDFQGAEGALRSGASTCTDTTAKPPKPVDVPPLAAIASIDGQASNIKVTTVADPETALADLSVKDRVFGITIQPAGAALTKALPTNGPIALEFPF